MRKAMDTLSKRGIVFDISGSGKVIWQHPKEPCQSWNHL